MTRFSQLVPDEYDHWYYHRPTGFLLYNNSEYGWVAINRKHRANEVHKELTEALQELCHKNITNPKEALPLPDDYDGEPLCQDCYEPKTHVDEPMVSGVRGWFCHNDDCPRDS